MEKQNAWKQALYETMTLRKTDSVFLDGRGVVRLPNNALHFLLFRFEWLIYVSLHVQHLRKLNNTRAKLFQNTKFHHALHFWRTHFKMNVFPTRSTNHSVLRLTSKYETSSCCFECRAPQGRYAVCHAVLTMPQCKHHTIHLTVCVYCCLPKQRLRHPRCPPLQPEPLLCDGN